LICRIDATGVKKYLSLLQSLPLCRLFSRELSNFLKIFYGPIRRSSGGGFFVAKGGKYRLKVFISQPMSGRSREEILAERKAIIDSLSSRIEKVEVIDSFIEDDFLKSSSSVWCLGKSIEMMSQAKLAVFGKGWEGARGCRIEHDVCEAYGIEILDLDSIGGPEGK
jgi:hypothetical protein